MAKLIERDGKHFRLRRGVEVEIPSEWVGKTLRAQTKRKRHSKQVPSVRKKVHRNIGKSGVFTDTFVQHRHDMIDNEA